jgi:hypothetical protein
MPRWSSSRLKPEKRRLGATPTPSATQEIEEARRDPGAAVGPGRPATPGRRVAEVDGAAAEADEGLEAPLLVEPVRKVLLRDAAGAAWPRQVRALQGDEAVGLLEGDAAERQTVDDGVGARGDADPQGHGDDRGQAGGGAPGEAAEGVADLAPEGFHRSEGRVDHQEGRHEQGQPGQPQPGGMPLAKPVGEGEEQPPHAPLTQGGEGRQDHSPEPDRRAEKRDGGHDLRAAREIVAHELAEVALLGRDGDRYPQGAGQEAEGGGERPYGTSLRGPMAYSAVSVRTKRCPPEMAGEALQVPGSEFRTTSGIAAVASTMVVSHASERK